jgi:DNA repair protein RadC
MSEKQQQDKVRKQLLQQNAQSLTDYELISFLLRSGSQGKTTVELAEELLIQLGGLPGLLEVQPQLFCQIKGLGESKYLLFKACIELAWRLHRFFEHVDIPLVFDKTYQFLFSKMRNRGYPALFGLFLDKQHNPLTLEHIIYGEVYESELILEEVLNKASLYQASTFMLVHNDPIGDGCPIPIDIFLSHKTVRELFAMELQMIDYVVIGRFHHTSLANKGFLKL